MRKKAQTLPLSICRAAQPAKIAPAYVCLASHDSCHVAGEVIFETGGEKTGVMESPGATAV